MGGSSSSDTKTTEINTTTTTSMGDVGLTGQSAVDMAAILQTVAIESTRISAASLDTLIQTVGKSSQQLIGGASELVRTQGEIAAQGGTDLMKLAPFLAIAAVVVLPLMLKRGKR